MSEFLKVKDKVKYLTLALVEQEDFFWHGYTIKKFLIQNFEINKEIVYPTIRNMQEKGFLEHQNIFNEETSKQQKKFKITQSGKDELVDFKRQIEEFESILAKIKSKEGFDYE